MHIKYDNELVTQVMFDLYRNYIYERTNLGFAGGGMLNAIAQLGPDGYTAIRDGNNKPDDIQMPKIFEVALNGLKTLHAKEQKVIECRLYRHSGLPCTHQAGKVDMSPPTFTKYYDSGVQKLYKLIKPHEFQAVMDGHISARIKKKITASATVTPSTTRTGKYLWAKQNKKPSFNQILKDVNEQLDGNDEVIIQSSPVLHIT